MVVTAMEFFDAIICTTLKDELSTVCIWDANNGTLITKYRGGGACDVHGLASSGGYILTCERGKPLVHAWYFNKQHPENKRLFAPGKINTIAFSPENVHIAVSVGEKVHLYKACSGKLIGIAARHFQPITVMKFSNDGSILCCGGEDGLITVWDTQVFYIKEKLPEPLFTFSDHSLPVMDLFITVGRNVKIYSVSEDMTCKVFDLISKQLLLSLVFYVRLSCVTLSPLNSVIFIGNIEGGIHMFSLTDPPRTVEYHLQQNESIPTFLGHEKTVTSLASTTDCDHLISGSLDETIKIWNVSSKSCLKTITQKGPVTNILYIPFFPKDVFDPNFTPLALLHDFINPVNVDENDEQSVEVFHSQHLLPCLPQEGSDRIALTKGRIELSEEMFKTINNKLYKFALRKILEKRPSDAEPIASKSKKIKTKKCFSSTSI